MSPSPAPHTPVEGLAIVDQPSEPVADTAHLHELIASVCRDERRFLGFPDHLGLVVGELAPLLAMFAEDRFKGAGARTAVNELAIDLSVAGLEAIA